MVKVLPVRMLHIIVLLRLRANRKNGRERQVLKWKHLQRFEVGLLTVYDMCKAIDKGMIIGPTYLVEKKAGKVDILSVPL